MGHGTAFGIWHSSIKHGVGVYWTFFEGGIDQRQVAK